MTRFADGPAQGKVLMLKRSPRFLRVVEKDGIWDALDQPDDTPAAGEKIYAYEITGEPGMIHLNTGRKPGGGFFSSAEYRICPKQPRLDVMWASDTWKRWCEDQKGA